MKTKRILFILLGLSLALITKLSAAPLDSGFTYQGSLMDGTEVANGDYDFRFILRDAPSAGTQVGPEVIKNPVVVQGGLFTVTLDFGILAFNGDARWLEIGVRASGSGDAYDILPPSQPLTATPYALVAKSLIGGGAGPVSFTNANNVFAGDGSRLTGIHSLDAVDGNPEDAVYVDAAGRVGMGTTNPAEHLDNSRLRLAQGHLALDYGYGVMALTLKDEDVVVGGNVFGGNVIRGSGIDTETDGSLNFLAGSLLTVPGIEFPPDPAHMVLKPNGYLGIGVQSPASRLHVAGDVRAIRFIGDGSQLTGLNAGGSLNSLQAADGTPAQAVFVDDIGSLYVDFTSSNDGTISSSPSLIFGALGSGEGIGSKRTDGGNKYGLDFYTGFNRRLSIAQNGNVGIGTGDQYPSDRLHVVGNTRIEGIDGFAFLKVAALSNALYGSFLSIDATAVNSGDGDEYLMFSTARDAAEGPGKLVIRNHSESINIMAFTTNGNVGIGTMNPVAKLDVAGTARVDVLEIDGGADVAEPYTVAALEDVVPKPGMLVSIDPDHVGRMRVASGAYDRTVAGIISGANGIRPGITLRQEGTVADGTMPIAGVGRVWAYCDADANGPIRAGDMLTTSDTPGHAMRVTDHDRANGAVIGKAMSNLKAGQGMVLVFVSLK